MIVALTSLLAMMFRSEWIERSWSTRPRSSSLTCRSTRSYLSTLTSGPTPTSSPNIESSSKAAMSTVLTGGSASGVWANASPRSFSEDDWASPTGVPARTTSEAASAIARRLLMPVPKSPGTF